MLIANHRWSWVVAAGAVALMAAIAVLMWQGPLPRGPQIAEAAPNIDIDVGDRWFCDVGSQGGVCDREVVVGDSVTWTWVGGLPHSVTECGENWNKGLTCSGDGGADWTSVTQSSGTFTRQFNTPGTFYYRCTVHPTFMRGTVAVIPPPVGGIAELPDVDGTPLETEGSSALGAGGIAGIAAGVAALAVALTGGAWYVRRRVTR